MGTKVLVQKPAAERARHTHERGRTLFHGAEHQSIANTFVQLIRRSISGVIALSRLIRSDQRCRKTPD